MKFLDARFTRVVLTALWDYGFNPQYKRCMMYHKPKTHVEE